MVKKIFFIVVFLCLILPGWVRAENRCPNAETKQIIDGLWTFWRPQLQSSLKNTLSPGNSQVLYYIQHDTNNLLDYSENCGDVQKLDELVNVYLTAFDYLSLAPNGSRQWFCSASACPGYPNNKDKEVVLYSSQFVYLLARTTNIIAGLDPVKVTSSMRQFLEKYTPVIVDDHLKRWIVGEKLFGVGGWKCADAGVYNHKEFMQKKIDHSLGNTPTYCNVIRDIDMWIAAASAEMLMADSRSGLVNLNLTIKSELKEDVRLVSELLKSRLVETNLVDFSGRAVSGYVLEPGEWRDYPDWAYAGYTGSSYPGDGDKKTVATVGWDISHARRFVNAFGSLYRTKNYTDQTFPEKAVLTKLANQMAYRIFNGDFEKPLFANFWDGSNGWYRVDYPDSGKVWAYGPSDNSLAFMTGGYGFWGEYNPDIDRIMTASWRLIKSTKPEDIAFRNRSYGTRYVNYQRTTPDNFSFSKSINLLEMLPTLFSVDLVPMIIPTVTLAPCPKKTIGDANCDGKVDINDFGMWKVEFIQKGIQKTADFDGDGKVSIIDFGIWKVGFLVGR